MTPNPVETTAADRPQGTPSFFKFMVVGSALFIAGCSAFFSVMGLGMLFVGSATAVMVMASSLEVGKLVASSFLYRYWPHITTPIRIYLTLAVLLLVGITSLGNYGYLARAYEKTHTQITLLERQIASLETELADTQKQIDGARGTQTRSSDNNREERAALNKRILEANDLLLQSLARVQDKRQAAQARRDRDLQALTQKRAELTAAFPQLIASDEAAIAALNARLAVMDRAVDAYTKEGGERFLKGDSIKKGQDLRDSQKLERLSIATQIARIQSDIEQQRHALAGRSEAVDREAAAVREQFTQDLAQLDGEEKDLRQARITALVPLTQQLAALQTEGQTNTTAQSTQVAALYERMRARNAEISNLRAQIAEVDIGSYRFVARAFEAGADDLVKWLILVLVLVFDPLAVSMVIGFNVVVMRERARGPAAAPADRGAEEALAGATARSGQPAWAVSGIVVLAIAALLATLALLGYWAFKARQGKDLTSHAASIPADSFAVLTLHTAELRSSAPHGALADWLGKSAAQTVAGAVGGLMESGLDTKADVYVFAKFPAGAAAVREDRPVLLCGCVVRVTDPRAAEAALSGLADQLSSSLRSSNAAPSVTAQNRTMIRCGDGRYLDPEGGFFTFGLRDHTAILMVELEGDPQAPRIEEEMRLCLARQPAGRDALTDAPAPLPARALVRDGALGLWLDAGKFFSRLPKNSAATARYQKLERHLAFELMLKVKTVGADQLKVAAEYVYQADRFKDRQQPTPVQLLAHLGPDGSAGLGGRLMERCADTLDYDSLIERLRAAFDASDAMRTQQVLVEKSVTSPRDARFTLSVRYQPQQGLPLFAAVQTLLR